jgi:hypothetical protein
MASDFSVAWQCLWKRIIGFLLRIKLHALIQLGVSPPCSLEHFYRAQQNLSSVHKIGWRPAEKKSPVFFQHARSISRFLWLQVGLGTDVMITLFCDFWRFSAKNWRFFHKTNVMIEVLHNLALFWGQKRQFFADFFGENILKIITSVLGKQTRDRTSCSSSMGGNY